MRKTKEKYNNRENINRRPLKIIATETYLFIQRTNVVPGRETNLKNRGPEMYMEEPF